MSIRRPWAAVALALAATLGLTACSGGSESSTPSAVETTAAEGSQTTVPTAEETEESVATTEAPDPAPLVFDVLATEPTAPGPRPLLSWDDVEGAATYDLIVLDAAGSPYWAWSGQTTSVHLGGVENPDAVGAWVFEPLTWIVTARDATGEPLAMSASAELLP